MADMINRPPHYEGKNGMEAVDCVRAFLTEDEYRGWCKGNALKYILRERKKGHDEDLRKAGWFLDEINGKHLDNPKTYEFQFDSIKPIVRSGMGTLERGQLMLFRETMCVSGRCLRATGIFLSRHLNARRRNCNVPDGFRGRPFVFRL